MPATRTGRLLDSDFFPTSIGLRRSARIKPSPQPTRASPRHQRQQSAVVVAATARGSSKSRTPPVKRRRTPVDTTPSHNVQSSTSTSDKATAPPAPPPPTTKASLKRKVESSEASEDASQIGRKKRKENNVVADKRRTATANATPVTSSKRKVDSLADNEEAQGAITTTRRKKRKENSEEPLKLSHHLHTMRAMIPNKPRERAPTNKYGTRSAASALPPVEMTDSPSPPNEAATRDVENVEPVPTSESTSVSSVSETQALVSSHTSTSPRLEDTLIPTAIPVAESIPLPAVAEYTTQPFDQPLAVDHVLLDPALPIEAVPEATTIPVPNPEHITSSSSYVTYTNLTPSFPQGNFDIPVDIPVAGTSDFIPTQESSTASLLSELNAEFAYPTGDMSLLDTSGGQVYVPSLQDQVDGVPVPFNVQGCTGPEMTLPMNNNSNVGGVLQVQGSLNSGVQDWQQQEQANADARRQKKARQDQEKVWQPRVKRYYNGFFVIAGGWEKVRETVQLQQRQYEARKLMAISSTNTLSSSTNTLSSSTELPSSSPIWESPPAPLSFENVHAETYKNGELEGDDDDDDDTEDSFEEDADADVENRAFPSPDDIQVPGQNEFATIHSLEADVNLSVPYTPEIPKMPFQRPHPNPDSFAIHAPPSTLGTPPFLERRQDWGGIFPTMWLRHSSDTSKTGSCLFLEHRNVMRSDLCFVLTPPIHAVHYTSSSEYLLPDHSMSSDPGMITVPSMSPDQVMSNSPPPPTTELSYDDNEIFQQMALGMKKDVIMGGPSDLGYNFGDSGTWGVWEPEPTPAFPRSGLSTLDSALG